MKVLHITDLHINDPDGDEEALRDDFFDEFLESLLDLLEDQSVNALVVTGDLVNIAKVEHFSHVQKVLTYISKQLSIKTENIYIVNGNHDMPRDTGDLEAFKKVLGDFGSKIVEDSYYLSKINSEYSILGLNSIGSNYTSGLPSSLSAALKKQLIRELKGSNLNNLIVLSHHLPMSHQASRQAPFDEGDESERSSTKRGWNESHIWNEGGHLLRRISKNTTTKGNVFWFGGDIHRPEFLNEDDTNFVIATGSLNTHPGNSSAISPQARLIDLKEPKNSKHFEFKFDGHYRKELEGRWREENLDITHISNGQRVDSKLVKTDNEDTCNTPPDLKKVISQSTSKYNLIDKALNALISQSIKENGLYRTGQFETCEEFTALSWVNIKDLLKRTEVYNSVINCFKRQLDEILKEGISKSDIILVGVDTWGAILATRLGLAANIRSCCIAARGEAIRYDKDEVVNERLKAIVESKKVVVAISDVLATGKTLCSVNKSLKVKSAKWVAFSILCDPSYQRHENLKGFETIYLACDDIKMPFIETNKLPDANMLNRDISFVTR